jgi:predicted AlkP superfamily phosphohydrolase/phosphomutase
MTERRFKAFRHFYKKELYDFAMIVEMGIDRIHHGFWRFFDKTHRLYEPGNPYENAIHDYYCALDEEIGRTLDIIDDTTAVMVVSDHGAKPMKGAICINEWLQKEGLLVLKEKPKQQMRMTMDMVDWDKTRVWGEGGYYGRIFLNVKGREPRGIIPQQEYESFRDELKAKLEAIEDEEGRNINTKVFKAEELYRQVNNIAPDLIVYLGNLDWRSAGSVGIGAIHLFENDTGPDDANHAQEGIFILTVPGKKIEKQQDTYSIYDIAPTILRYFDIEVPDDMIGNSII